MARLSSGWASDATEVGVTQAPLQWPWRRILGMVSLSSVALCSQRVSSLSHQASPDPGQRQAPRGPEHCLFPLHRRPRMSIGRPHPGCHSAVQGHFSPALLQWCFGAVGVAGQVTGELETSVALMAGPRDLFVPSGHRWLKAPPGLPLPRCVFLKDISSICSYLEAEGAYE